MQVIISLSKVIGIMAFMMAILFPVWKHLFVIKADKAWITEQAQDIASKEILYYKRNFQNFILFGEGQSISMSAGLSELGHAALKRKDINFETFLNAKGQLVVRARSSKDSIKQGDFPLFYELTSPVDKIDSSESVGKWIQSSKKWWIVF